MARKSMFSGGSGGMANNNHYDWRERNTLRHSGDDETLTPQQYVLKRWPRAMGIRMEASRCPNCRHTGRFVSFALPQYVDVREVGGVLHEDCGYVCCVCGWSNAGARPVRNETEGE